MIHIDQLLQMLVDKEASDLHLRVGEPPVMRIHGDLKRLDGFEPLNDADMGDLLYGMMNDERRVRFEQNMELDMSYQVPGLSRFRVNIFRQQGHVGAVLRVIPFNVRTIDELMLPEVTKELCMKPRGLILVTGPTAAGEATSLSATSNHFNENHPKNTFTIEDPTTKMNRDKHTAINQ